MSFFLSHVLTFDFVKKNLPTEVPAEQNPPRKSEFVVENPSTEINQDEQKHNNVIAEQPPIVSSQSGICSESEKRLKIRRQKKKIK